MDDKPFIPPSIEHMRYIRLAAGPWHSLIVVGVLLLFFHVGFLICRPPVSLLATKHLTHLLAFLGGTAQSVLAAAAIAFILLGQQLVAKPRFWQIYPDVLLGMVVEGILWMLPLLAVGSLAQRMLLEAGTYTDPTIMQRVVASVGAGIYEEFLFRLIGIGLLCVPLIDMANISKRTAAAAAIAITAIAFSLYHPQTLSGENFHVGSFIYFAVAGAYLGFVYVLRGFGVVVVTHATFNIMVLTVLNGR
jgi:hypothetical protein